MIKTFKLALSKGQIARLLLSFDEDLSKVISLEEYQNALEAYKCGVDKHVAADGSDYFLNF